MARRNVALLIPALALAIAACSLEGCAKSRGGGSSKSGRSASGGTIGNGPLAAKAADFEERMQRLHLAHGFAQDVRLDANGQPQRRGGDSRPLWTACYAAAELWRYRTTGEPEALANMERSMWALHDLAKITGIPGVIARGFDEPRFDPNGIPATTPGYTGYNYASNPPSRDQYTGWFFGVALCYDAITDPQLRAALAEDCREIARLLEQHDLAPVVQWNGKTKELFNLNPDATRAGNITPQEWARVDDFPLNLIVRSVPYDPQLAQALANLKIPPLRAGEAMRAITFLSVAAYVTGDASIRSYRDRLLWGPKDFATIIERYTLIQDDLLNGRNTAAVRAIFSDLSVTITQLIDIWLQSRGQSALVRFLVQPIAGGLSQWVTGQLADLFAFLTDPNNQNRLDRIKANLQFVAGALRLLGLDNAARGLERFLQTYGPHLNRQGLRELADTMRAYNGFNLGFMANAALLEVERDPALRAICQSVLERRWSYIANEKNPWFNLLHARYGLAPGPRDFADSIESLRRYWVDLSVRAVDNSQWPGLRVSIWPDRFGRVGNRASEPIAFPIDARQPHIFPWQGHPREIVNTANDPQRKIAPVGYLAPYWLARELGALGPAD